MSQHIYTYDASQDQLNEIGGAGHIIKDAAGTSYTKRENLQFVGTTVTDDSTNNTTIVSVDETNFVGTLAQWNALTLAQKAKYKTVDLTDDFNGDPIDATPTANSQHAVQSGGTYTALATKADAADVTSINEALTNVKDDLTSISITGTTNNTGSTITEGTYFYLNGSLVKAKTDIANGATFTANTNYENAHVADVLDNPIAIKDFTNSSLVLSSTEGGQRIAGEIAINGYKPVSAIITYIGGDFNGSSLALCPYLVDDSYIFAHYKTTGATGTAEVKTRVIYVKDKVYTIK